MNTGKRFISALLVLLLLISWTLPGMAEAEGQTLSLPAAAAVIGEEAFMGDRSISVVRLPAAATDIGSRAFADCSALKDVYFPDRDVNIAEDAFEGCSGLTFHIYRNSEKNADYAADHGFAVAYIDQEPDPLTGLQDGLGSMLIDNPLTSSALAGDEDINRLILITDGSALPDELEAFGIQQIVSNGDHLYILQFAEGDMTSTRDCYDYLETWPGTRSVEYDRALESSIEDDEVSAASVWSGWEEDPMHFAEYSRYVAENNNGRSVVVAVLDSGVNTDIGHVLPGKDCVNLVNPNPHSDIREHGTAVAGVIVDCSGGLDVNILPVKVAENSGKILCSKLILALDYAIGQKVDIINMSFVTDDSPAARYYIETAIDRGITVVAAAGNVSGDIAGHFPANVDRVISVSGIGPDKTGGSYSLLGDLTAGGTYAAPGSDLSVHRPGGKRRNVTGTSFAAPQICAAIALTMIDSQHTAADMDKFCEDVEGTVRGLPDLGKLAVKFVGAIDVALPSTMRYRDTLAPYGPFAIGYLPEDATDARFEVESLNPDVVEAYMEDGYLYLITKASGEADIVIRALDEGGYKKQVSVNVYSPVTSIDISGYSGTELHVGDSVQLKAEAKPAFADNRNVVWSTSDAGKAKVDASGRVTVISEGKVTITATAADGYGAKAAVEFAITAIPDPVGVSIDNAPETVAVGSSVVLKASVLPEDAPQDVIWDSSDPAVATIDEAGKLTAVSKGRTTIMVRPKTGTGLAYATIEVVQLPTSVTVSGPDTVRVSDTIQLTAVVAPDNANNKLVSWSSSDSTVATVSASGVVQGVRPGSAVIYAASQADGRVVGSHSVTVKPKTFQIIFDAGEGTADMGAITAVCGEPVGPLPSAALDYSVFGGWYLGNGTQLTEDSVFETDSDITVTARWTAKPYSGWVKESEVPAGARIADTKWTYTETTTSTATSMAGWTQSGSEWRKSGSGEFNWASFTYGFNTGNGLYTAYNRAPYTSYENDTSKRTVTNSVSKYIYWHWMYDNGGPYGTGQNAAIFYQAGYGEYWLTGNGYNYKYFDAFETTENFTYTADMAEGGNANWGQDDTYYIWYKCNRYARSYWWYKTPVYLCSYTDYTKYFTYTRTVETAQQPTASASISNIQKYVKYQQK